MAKRLPTTGGELTDDLLTEILLKLPIKFLLRFKSVSKSWLALISSHRFAKSHLLTSVSAAGDDETLIIHLRDDDEKEDGPFVLFNLGSVQIVKNLMFPYTQDEYHFLNKSSQLVGSDCGILCVDVYDDYVYDYDCHSAIDNSDIYLWNPTTKHSKRVPPHTIVTDSNAPVALSFGFDHIDLDFKVLRVLQHTLSAEVYSSNKNVWRKIDTIPIDSPYWFHFCVCLHGFLFGIGIGYNDMTAFNLNKEVFICNVKLPCKIKLPLNVHISDFNDSVAVFMYDRLDKKVKLWTLNDEACLGGGKVEASWTMMLSIDVVVHHRHRLPLESLDTLFNLFLMVDDHEWLVYNYINKGTRYVTHDPCFEPYEVFKYKESLFSIAGSKCVKWSASSSRLQDESDSNEESIPDMIQ